MKRLLAFLLAALLLSTPALAVEVLPEESMNLACTSAVLMEKESGSLIYAKNAHERLSPASVTKVMSLLLVAEAVDGGIISLDDTVSASARAASMGGSQIWLKEGEQLTVGELIKCVAVVSANDCTVALAEYLAGSEDAFVANMNERAAKLGLQDTHFTNSTGLFEDDNHYTSAYDVAIMSRMLLSHDFIRQYTTIWMDTIRDGAFGLTNTNRLVRFYPGATGLKTGFTTKAMYCLSASAERNGVEYIAVIMHGDTSDKRFEAAKALLDYAFSNYTTVSLRMPDPLSPVLVELGGKESVQPVYEGPEKALVEKSNTKELRYEPELAERVQAPVSAGQRLGTLRVYTGEELLAEVPIVAADAVERMNTWKIFLMFSRRLMGGE
jgi:D-alanyl-D-alanine carboxypeptidase (penicillin-binding protein 5/6)